MTDAPPAVDSGSERRFARRVAPFRTRDFRLLFPEFLIAGGFAIAGLLTALPSTPVLLVVGLGAAVVALALAPLLVRADRKAAGVAAGLASRAAALERVALFHGLARPALERLAASPTERRPATGAVQLRDGHPTGALRVLVSGVLDASAVASEALPAVEAPDAVGEMGVLRALPRTVAVVAASAAEVLRIGTQDHLAEVTPERSPLLFSGSPAARLARTRPQLVGAAEPA